ncbi:mitochondrial intermediate peptidase [Flagelloscypha sp. PMI_526]|nr:mitochondrial intermediate peptidase [Flagelloscypha sp. PMI_526]
MLPGNVLSRLSQQLRPRRPRRLYHTSRVSRAVPTADFIQPATQDDRALVSLFDQRSRLKACLPSFTYDGLLGHRILTNDRALETLANSTLLRARLLTERICRAQESREELLKVVKNLDRLSDMLCGVIDLTELIRNCHPDRKWVDAANRAYEDMCAFMNELNTHSGLYEALKVVLRDPSIVKTLSPEAYATALIFWRDFERSIVAPDQRSKFIDLTTEIIVLGREFQDGARDSRPPALIKPSSLEGLKDGGMGSRLKRQASSTQKTLVVYPGSLQAQMIMRSAPDEEARRQVYIASNTSSQKQLSIMENMLIKRAELARMVGKESFGHMVLSDKMAKSPENIDSFLDALLDHTRPFARDALQALSQRKQAQQNLSYLPVIQAWDRDYYCPPEPPSPPVPLPPLTVGTAFMALSRLFRHIYGITFRHVETKSGEVWHREVQKLEVVDDSEGVVGVIYADLFSRPNKPGGAAHYTVRCSRRVDDDDVAGDQVPDSYQYATRESLEYESEMPHRKDSLGHIHQLPLVVLLCDFSSGSLSGPAVLQWSDVTTLFHEMGHAMHSMIGRTDYQNVAGTRCATDFVELPSILMEHFLDSPRVLSLFNVDSTRTMKGEGNHHSDPCHSIDTYNQIILAAIDQIYHSPTVLDPSFDSTKKWAALLDSRGIIPYVPGTSYPTLFGHLYSYGATYYSYLFDRAIAAKVWKDLFARDPLDRETGEKYKRKVLRYGGGKDPWKMVSQLLNNPVLENGDAEAMKEVGRWRINDDVGLPGRH